jgi:TolB-like protein/Flp pilus assembly protein TadD
MGAESPHRVGAQAGAVFLSYASQDAQAASRIYSALQAGGIEVWLDQSELRGGDAWDRQIRERIHDCRLFIALISAHTEARDEGYFRREWKLAVDRTHDMSEKKAFLLPVLIDATPERGAAVPEKFHEVQWTRLSGGETPPEFVARIKRLLSPEPPATARAPADAPSGSLPIPQKTGGPSPLRPAHALAAAVLVLAAFTYLLINKQRISKPAEPPAAIQATPSPGPPSPAFNPPPHSIAVLPFVNLSGDKEQEYFSDGLSEELLNSLARINELQVAARTSSFYFKGKDADLNTIARKLNVASVLEGSVRRSAHTLRVTAQLNNAITGYHLWSQTYDRDLKDVLEMQTEIAGAVADALKVTLLGDLATKVELGGTRKPAAFDAYIRATKAHFMSTTAKEEQDAADGFTRALRLDPEYALAYAGRSLAVSSSLFTLATREPSTRASGERALADARKSIALAPDLADGHLALAVAYEALLEFTRAGEEYEHALTLAPTNAHVLRDYGLFSVFMGKSESGLTMLRRAVVLDPLNYVIHMYLGLGLRALRRYDEAIIALGDGVALEPAADIRTELGFTQYLVGDLQAAVEGALG